MDIWREYYDSFAKRLERIPSDAFDRKHLLYQAAHGTYEEVTNALTTRGVDDENALFQGKRFSTAAKDWIDSGDTKIENLQHELEHISRHP